MIQHLQEQLSAYVDDALAPEERRAVETHLAECAQCRMQLAELRAVSGLLASLPQPVPRRSLVPRRAPAWLVPARFLSSVAAAAFVLVFAVNSLAPTGHFNAAAPAAAPQVRFDAVTSPSAPPAPQPAAAPATAATTADAAQKLATGATASPQVRGPAGASPTTALTESRPTPLPRGAAPEERATTNAAPAPAFPAWLWLVAAAIAAAFAFVLHRAIRRARR